VRPTVNRFLREIHDDLDLSFHLQAEMTVLFDPTLRVGVSARPFYSWRALGRRLSWSYKTFRINFREETPWQRRAYARGVLRRSRPRGPRAFHPLRLTRRLVSSINSPKIVVRKIEDRSNFTAPDPQLRSDLEPCEWLQTTTQLRMRLLHIFELFQDRLARQIDGKIPHSRPRR
jgi:hypothetical protein